MYTSLLLDDVSVFSARMYVLIIGFYFSWHLMDETESKHIL